MKNSILLLLSLILGATSLFGQEQRQSNYTPEERIQKVIDGFSEKVNLTEQQKAGMMKVLLSHHQERRALGREADRQQRMELRNKKSTDLQSVFGDEETYKAFRAYMMENRKAHYQNRKRHGQRKGSDMQQRKRQGSEGRTRPAPERRQGGQ